jgi:hypothetical protein
VPASRAAASLAALAAAIALTTTAATAAPPRGELLRPGVGVGAVRLGMTFSQVRAVLGRPSRVRDRDPYGFGEYVQYAWGVDGAWEVGLYGRSPASSRVVLVSTSRSARTPQGAGVGSTHASLRRVLGARCYRQRVGPKIPDAAVPHRDFVSCWLGRPEGPVTVFSLFTECTISRERYSVTCPDDKRRYRALEVSIASNLGQRILRLDEREASGAND